MGCRERERGGGRKKKSRIRYEGRQEAQRASRMNRNIQLPGVGVGEKPL